MGEIIIFEDKNFEDIVRRKIGVYDRPITADDVKDVKGLSVYGSSYFEDQKIHSLKGIEYFYGLEDLRINDVKVENGLKIIENCKNLKVLFMNNCGLENLHRIEKFQGLEAVSFGGNQLESAEELGQLKELFQIGLVNNKLKDIGFCATLEKLESLNLSMNEIESLKGLEDKLELKILRVSENKISSIAELKDNVNLETLDIDCNNIKSTKELRKLHNLQQLNISRNPEIDSIDELSGLKGMKSLSISNNKKINDYSPISEMKNLSYLNLSYSNVASLEFLKDFKSLKFLNLDRSKISDELELDQVARNNNFESLDYYKTDLEQKLKDKKVEFTSKVIGEAVREALFGDGSSQREINEKDVRYKLKLALNKVDSLDELDKFSNLKKLKLKYIEDHNYRLDIFKDLNKIGTLMEVAIYKENFDLEQAKILDKSDLLYDINIIYKDKEDEQSYLISEYVEIEDAIEKITSSVDKNWTELEKARFVYEKLGQFITYDSSGNLSSYSEKEAEGEQAQKRVKQTRNLYGPIVEGKAVCVGYAVAFKEICNRVGLECECIGGNVPNVEQSYHRWNVLKIDGVWYQCDLTWDARRVKNHEKLEYFCLSENTMRKDHTQDTHSNHFDCPNDISQREILQAELKTGIRCAKISGAHFDGHEKVNDFRDTALAAHNLIEEEMTRVR